LTSIKAKQESWVKDLVGAVKAKVRERLVRAEVRGPPSRKEENPLSPSQSITQIPGFLFPSIFPFLLTFSLSKVKNKEILKA